MKPAETSFINTYVPIPFNEIATAAKMNEDSRNTAAAKSAKMFESTSMNNLIESESYAKGFEQANNFINNRVAELASGLPQADNVGIANIQREAGNLRNIVRYNEDVQKQYANDRGILDAAASKDPYMAYARDKFRADTSKFNFGDYYRSPQITSVPNPKEEAFEMAKVMEPTVRNRFGNDIDAYYLSLKVDPKGLNRVAESLINRYKNNDNVMNSWLYASGLGEFQDGNFVSPLHDEKGRINDKAMTDFVRNMLVGHEYQIDTLSIPRSSGDKKEAAPNYSGYPITENVARAVPHDYTPALNAIDALFMPEPIPANQAFPELKDNGLISGNVGPSGGFDPSIGYSMARSEAIKNEPEIRKRYENARNANRAIARNIVNSSPELASSMGIGSYNIENISDADMSNFIKSAVAPHLQDPSGDPTTFATSIETSFQNAEGENRKFLNKVNAQFNNPNQNTSFRIQEYSDQSLLNPFRSPTGFNDTKKHLSSIMNVDGGFSDNAKEQMVNNLRLVWSPESDKPRWETSASIGGKAYRFMSEVEGDAEALSAPINRAFRKLEVLRGSNVNPDKPETVTEYQKSLAAPENIASPSLTNLGKPFTEFRNRNGASIDLWVKIIPFEGPRIIGSAKYPNGAVEPARIYDPQELIDIFGTAYQTYYDMPGAKPNTNQAPSDRIVSDSN